MTVGGLFALLLPSFDGFHFSFNSDAINLATMAVLEKLAWLSGAFLVALGIIALLAKFFTPRLTLLRRFVLVGEQNASEGFVAGPSIDSLPSVGSNAKAYSPLRPSGKIEIEGKIYDAMTDGGFIEKDSSVVVLRIEGSKIIVKNRS
jgi:membrane-bound serine protease (ClpP class)